MHPTRRSTTHSLPLNILGRVGSDGSDGSDDTWLLSFGEREAIAGVAGAGRGEHAEAAAVQQQIYQPMADEISKNRKIGGNKL